MRYINRGQLQPTYPAGLSRLNNLERKYFKRHTWNTLPLLP